MKKILFPLSLVLILFSFAFVQFGCGEPTFPKDKIIQSIKEVCLKDHGIKDVEVQVQGKTIGVFLPLQQLFHSDFEHVLATGKVTNLESLLQFSPEALEKVDDVLFSTSRVVLSTDMDIDFYQLKAVDTESTGIEFVLIGYVDDIKRVRFWDIPRSEYQKRVLHDLKINRAVLWHRPVQRLFQDMNQLPVVELLDQYFISGTNLNMISPFFYSYLLETQFKDSEGLNIVDIRSTGFKQNQALVYVKVNEKFKVKQEYEDHKFLIPSDYDAEFLFILIQQGNQYRISRVIPFDYLDKDNKPQKIQFPKELQLYQNIENWETNYELEEIKFTEFLSRQITFRVGGLVFNDERIENTLGKVKPELTFVDAAIGKETKEETSQEAVEPEKGYFLLKSVLTPQNLIPTLEDSIPTLEPIEEDKGYYLQQVLQLITKVLRFYSFQGYSGIQVEMPYSDKQIFLDLNQLEEIRKQKFDPTQFFSK